MERGGGTSAPGVARRVGAAPVTARQLLTGPDQPTTVVATAGATYLATGAATAPVLSLATTTALRLPCAVLVAEALPPWRPGTTGVCGRGRIAVAGTTIRIARWWRPPAPRLSAGAPLRPAATWLARDHPQPLDAHGRDAATRLIRSLTGDDPRPPRAALDALLGRGAGLTPVGDDVVTALMVTLRAGAHPAAAALSTAIREAVAPVLRPREPDARTTVVSAALLWHATHGHCIPELAALLHHLGTAADTGTRWRAAADRLLRVGHSSGAGMLAGVALGVAMLACDERTPPHPPATVAPAATTVTGASR